MGSLSEKRWRVGGCTSIPDEGAALCVETVAYKAGTASMCREMFACM